MQPKSQNRDAFELFQAHFDQLLNPAHELLQLAAKMDWDRFEVAFAGGYSPDLGAPAKATRLMVGLQYLKYTFNESDESVVARWVENPYWQSFCGYTHLQHECPAAVTTSFKVVSSRVCEVKRLNSICSWCTYVAQFHSCSASFCSMNLVASPSNA